ncbi:MAG TPA: endonuclease/exonuclease/phosphatase family protein [Bdellovibrionales bacterium]|nr:endonuclease/exonuclease/phosphatase family protein [Bdellovibrionales bacterium]
MKGWHLGWITACAVFVAAQISPQAGQAQNIDRDGRGPIKIMAYNVENLFDAEHDRGKKDFEFLPTNHPQKANCETVKYKNACFKLDWTQAKIDLKLVQIAKIVNAQGTLPDVLVLEEVENERVVSRLGSILGYQYVVMTNSPDERGIDVAILYREDKMRFINQMQARVNLKFPTRDLLVANFQMPNGEVLGVYANHWPSQLTPDSTVRLVVAQQVRAFVDSVGAKFGDKYHVVLTGDFNTIPGDRPHPFKEVIQHKSWTRRFANVRELYEQGGGKDLPPGTYYFARDKVWNEFDIFFASGNLYDGTGLDVMVDSFKMVAPEWATKIVSLMDELPSTMQELVAGRAVRVPKGYDHHATSEKDAGYSDHFGIVVRIKTGK